jgi:heptaprenyl diphosphate synthase
MNSSAAKMSMLGVFTALSLALSVAETMLAPMSAVPVPGLKLGLANIVILLSVYMLGAVPSLAIVLVRTSAVFFFGGNLIGFLFSLFGGLCALGVMLILRNTRKFSLFGISAGGAAAHSAGQILAAILLTRTWEIVAYLPVLLIASVAAGLITAMIAVPIFRAMEMSLRAPKT